jgi:RimJ/RimL family protein N-acetyltransferase
MYRMLNFNIVLENEQVMLRPLLSADISRFEELTTDSAMWIFSTTDLSYPGQLQKWMNTAMEQMRLHTRIAFTIIDKKNNEVVGSTSFGNISEYDKRIEIGWTWLGRPYRGVGFNNHCKYLMLRYCFEELDFERVEIKTDVLNVAARKALARMGFIEEGILRSHTLMTHNRRRDTIYYSVLRSEWEEMKLKNTWK